MANRTNNEKLKPETNPLDFYCMRFFAIKFYMYVRFWQTLYLHFGRRFFLLLLLLVKFKSSEKALTTIYDVLKIVVNLHCE